MPTRSTQELLQSRNRDELLKLSERLIDALGERLTHRLVQNAPVQPPNEHQQLELYAVDVHGVTSNVAEAAQRLLAYPQEALIKQGQHEDRHGIDNVYNHLFDTCRTLKETLREAAETDFVDGAFCASLMIETTRAIVHTTGQAHAPDRLFDMTEESVNTLGQSLAGQSTYASFTRFIDVLTSLHELFDDEQRRALFETATANWPYDSLAHHIEQWLRERTVWSSTASIVAQLWSRRVEDARQREHVTSTVSIYLHEDPEISMILGEMHGSAGAVEDARYWLAEGLNRFPEDRAIERALTRWS